jgi:hypothetical protein
MEEQEQEELKALWIEGKQEKTDWQSASTTLKNEMMLRAGDNAIQSYRHNVQRAPMDVGRYLGVLSLEASLISKDGINYNSSPSSHLNDKDLERRGTWGDSGIDKMFSETWDDAGGRPSYGFVIASMPTGDGKTTLAISLAAYGLAYSTTDRITIMSNEMPRKTYSKGVLRALMSIYQGQESEESLKRMMDDRMQVFGPTSEDSGGMPVKSFELMRQILFWTSPQIAVMDSLNAVSFPDFANSNRMSEHQQHSIKANAFRDTCRDYGVLLYAPGNMSGILQDKLKANPNKMSSVMLFGSKEYESASDYSFLGWRDPNLMMHQYIKRCKNRHGTSKGELFPMIYDTVGGHYRTEVVRAN